jgi:hypothetical protein
MLEAEKHKIKARVSYNTNSLTSQNRITRQYIIILNGLLT